MKRPTSVRVGIHDVKIVWSKKGVARQHRHLLKTDPNFENEHDVLLGCYCGEDVTIYMLPRKDIETALRETLLHELLHCIGDLCGVPWQHDEESMVRVLSPNLLLVMEENPKVRRYLFGRD